MYNFNNKFYIILFLYLISYSNGLFQDENNINHISIENLIKNKGYGVEKHYITTEDGYILGAFRITNNLENNKILKPIILQHGLLDNSATWTFNGNNYSLPFILLDNGHYDIWLTNSRGNKYSLNHTRLNSDENEFWQFSFDDMARYDIIANVNYILNVTGSNNVAYIGHSQGTTIGFLSYLYNPELEFKMPIMIALAPVANITYMSSPLLRLLAKIHTDKLFQMFGRTEFMPFSISFHFLKICSKCNICCSSLIESIFGLHQLTFNNSIIPIITTLEPGGTSIKNMAHFVQLYNHKRFEHFDYGETMNQLYYNQSTPPAYDISKLPSSINIFIYSGKLDILSTRTDVYHLIHQLPKNIIKEWTILEKYSHIDFIWSLDSKDLIYYKILLQLKSLNY